MRNPDWASDPDLLLAVRQEEADADAVREMFEDLAPALSRMWRGGDGDGGGLFRLMRAAVEDYDPAALPRKDGPQSRGKRTISGTTRTRIYERDEYRCRRCGTHRDLSIDHIHPESLGGSDEDDNLQTLCRSCNSSKGARP